MSTEKFNTPKMPQAISLDQTDEMFCSKCNNPTFTPIFFLRLVPKVLVGESKDVVYPLQVWECAACGTIHPHSLPPEYLKELQELQKQKQTEKEKTDETKD